MKIRQNQKGFTLIEVVLVLAIGGLIFLLAFLAFQQVSTNRRDTQRRNDAGKVIAEIQNAAGDGFKITDQPTLGPAVGGTSATSGFVHTYMGGSLKGPNGDYKWTYIAPSGTAGGAVALTTAQQAAAAVDTVYVSPGASCTANSNVSFTQKSGANAVIIKLEKGSICRDDQ